MKRISAKIGEKFYDSIEGIKKERVKIGTSNISNVPSTALITNALTQHKYWKEIFSDISKISQEEIEKHGK